MYNLVVNKKSFKKIVSSIRLSNVKEPHIVKIGFFNVEFIDIVVFKQFVQNCFFDHTDM